MLRTNVHAKLELVRSTGIGDAVGALYGIFPIDPVISEAQIAREAGNADRGDSAARGARVKAVLGEIVRPCRAAYRTSRFGADSAGITKVAVPGALRADHRPVAVIDPHPGFV